MITTSIIALNTTVRLPITIIGFVIAIIIFAFNRVFIRWAMTHIFKKVCKRMHPTFTNRYAAFAISLIVRIVGICTSCFHSTPNTVSTGFGHSMRNADMTPIFRRNATTRFGVAIAKIASNGDENVATVTFNKPLCFRFLRHRLPGIAKNFQMVNFGFGAVKKIVSSWKRFKNNAILIVGHRFSFLESVITPTVRTTPWAFIILPNVGVFT